MNLFTKRTLLAPIAGIFLFALIIRLVYLHQASQDPEFLIPLVDSEAYDTAARTLATTGVMGRQFFWQAFFYPMLLTILYIFAGHSIATVVIVQAVVGAAVCVLVYHLGLKIFDRRIAVLAAVVTALYGPLIYFGGELLATIWAGFWALILILLFLNVVERPRMWACFLLGVCGGLSIITRATFVPFFLISSIWLAMAMRRKPMKWKPILLTELAILAGLLAVLLPVSIQCQRTTGLFTPLPESGPLNLYIGNNSDYAEIRAMRPGEEWDEILLMPVREGHRTRSEVQKFFSRKVVDYATKEPLSFVKRLGRKTMHFLSSREIPNNEDIYANRTTSRLYSILIWKINKFGFPFGALLPFVIIGLILNWRKIPPVIPLFLFFYSASIIMVFVTSRYRTPMIPVMAVIAAAGTWNLVETVKTRRWIKAIILLAFATATAITTSLPGPFASEKVNYNAEKHHYLALYYLNHGQIHLAIDRLNQSVEYDREYSEAYQSLGNAYVRQNNLDQASYYFEKAVQLKPNSYSAHNNLGSVLGRQGKFKEALPHFKKALEHNPLSDTLHFNIGVALYQLGRHEEALEHLRKAAFYSEQYGNRDLSAQIRDNFGRFLMEGAGEQR